MNGATDHTTIIEHEGRTFHIVGTAHVSARSVEEVREVIASVRPDSVAVELDAHRFEALTDEARWRKLDVFQVIRQGRVPFLLVSLALASFQARLGRKLGVKPGDELVAAATAAREVGATLVLADRDIQTTLRRTWANISLWQRFQLLGAIVESAFDDREVEEAELERLKQGEALDSMLRELAEAFPRVKGPLIDERDAYLAAKIEGAPGQSVVAVVGAAHVAGIRERFGKPVDLAALEVIPKKSRWVGLLQWIIPALVLGAFYIGWQRHSGEALVEMLVAWILPNSVLAALFSVFAGARLLSIATAFVVAPITTLNPALAAGMVVGLVEAWLRRPTVEDCERVREDIGSLRGIYRNRLTRVLLVTILSSVGAALGAWVGATWVVSLL